MADNGNHSLDSEEKNVSHQMVPVLFHDRFTNSNKARVIGPPGAWSLISSLNKTAKDFSKNERDAIVAKVTEELISPTELSQIHGVSISAIRGWVKTAGKKLPSRYKSSKPVTSTPPKSILMSSISDSAGSDESKTASAAIENDQTPHLHNIVDESEKPNEGK